MLPNDLAEVIANLRGALIPVGRLGSDLFRLLGGFQWFGKGPNFFDRANADAVGLAQARLTPGSQPPSSLRLGRVQRRWRAQPFVSDSEIGEPR